MTPNARDVADDRGRAARPRRVLTLPGRAAGASAPSLLIQLQILLDCSDGELARWRAAVLAGRHLPRPDRPLLTEAALPIALGIRADGGWDSIGGYTTLGLLAAVLVLLVRTESALVTSRAPRPGKPAGRGHARRSRRRARRGLRAAAPRRSASSRSSAPSWRSRRRCWRSPPRSSTRSRGDLGGTRALVIALVPVAAITAVGHLVAILASEPAAMSVRLRRAHAGPAAGRSCGAALDSLLRQRGVELDVVGGRQRLGAGRAARRRARRSRCAEDRGHPGRPQRRRRRTSRGELLFFLDDDAALAAPDALARVARAVRGRPGARAAAAARRAARRRRAAARLGAAAARRRPRRARATSPPCGRARWRCRARGLRGRSAAGRRSSASCTRASTSRWRVMDAGYRVALRRRHRRRCTRRRRGGAARLLVLLRGAQPGLARPPPPAAAARRRSTWSTSRCARCRALRSRRGAREALRGYRDGLRGPCGARAAAARADVVADDTRRAPPDHVSLLASSARPMSSPDPATTPPATAARTSSPAQRHVYEPHRVGLPPLRPVRARAVAPARVRVRAVAHEAARAALQHGRSGSSGWCSTRCCWRASTSCSSTSCARGLARPEFFAHLMAGLFAYYFVSDAIRDGVKSVVERRPADPQHGVPARAAAARRR